MNMIKIVSAAFALVAAEAFATPDGWIDDFDLAKERAAKENKLILADFSGSDWCIWCKRLDEEVFAKKEFVDEAQKDFVLLLIDSPSDESILTEKVKTQNKRLVKEYKIRGFPSVLILDKEGKKLRKTGYRRGGPKPYLEELAGLKKSIEAGEVDPEKVEQDKAAAYAAFIKKYWMDDLDAAKERAAKENKLILADFTSSDDRYSCKRFDDNVFAKKEFVDGAQKDFVLVRIDLPRDSSLLPEETMKRNRSLAKTYGVERYPTVLILSPAGKKLATAGYLSEGPESYLKMLAELQGPAMKYMAFLGSVEGLEKGSKERLEKIDGFFQEIGEKGAAKYDDFVNELLANDGDGAYAAKYPDLAFVRPALRKIREIVLPVGEAMDKRFFEDARKLHLFEPVKGAANPEEEAKKRAIEHMKLIAKEFAPQTREKHAEARRAVADIMAAAPESARVKIESFLNAMENELNVLFHGDSGKDAAGAPENDGAAGGRGAQSEKAK